MYKTPNHTSALEIPQSTLRRKKNSEPPWKNSNPIYDKIKYPQQASNKKILLQEHQQDGGIVVLRACTLTETQV